MSELPNPWANEPANMKQAVGFVFLLFGDSYGMLWQPEQTSAITWQHCLKDLSPTEVVQFGRLYVDAMGAPPSPAAFKDFIKKARAAEFQKRKTLASEFACAIEARDKIARLKAEGRWSERQESEREHLEAWAARAPASVSVDRFRSLNESDEIAMRLATEFLRGQMAQLGDGSRTATRSLPPRGGSA